MVDIKHKVFDIGEIFAAAERRREDAAHQIGQLPFEHAVAFGIDGADEAELPDLRLRFRFRVLQRMIDVRHRHFGQRIVWGGYIMSEQYHLSMFLNCWARFCA